MDMTAEGERSQVQHLEFWYKLVCAWGWPPNWGKLRKRQALGVLYVCPLDIHLEMADRELSNVEKCLYLL